MYVINATMTQQLAGQRIADLHREGASSRGGQITRNRVRRAARPWLTRRGH